MHWGCWCVHLGTRTRKIDKKDLFILLDIGLLLLGSSASHRTANSTNCKPGLGELNKAKQHQSLQCRKEKTPRTQDTEGYCKPMKRHFWYLNTDLHFCCKYKWDSLVAGYKRKTIEMPSLKTLLTAKHLFEYIQHVLLRSMTHMHCILIAALKPKGSP